MADGTKAMGLFNLTDKTAAIPVDIKDVQLSGKLKLRDLWRQNDLGMVENHFEMLAMPHGVRMIILKKPDN